MAAQDADERLIRYAEMLRLWAGRTDLVSERDLDRIEERHVRDSLRALPVIAEVGDGAAIDVGSGAGLPGIPLAIAEPQREWRLLEPRRKRVAFLEEVVRELELQCEVVPLTVEEAVRSGYGRRQRVATARALASPARSFELCMPLLAPGGVALVFVGERGDLPPNAATTADGIATMELPGPVSGRNW